MSGARQDAGAVRVVVNPGRSVHLRHYQFAAGDVLAVTAATAEQLIANGSARAEGAPEPGTRPPDAAHGVHGADT